MNRLEVYYIEIDQDRRQSDEQYVETGALIHSDVFVPLSDLNVVASHVSLHMVPTGRSLVVGFVPFNIISSGWSRSIRVLDGHIF